MPTSFFRSDTDIANLALQAIGAPRVAALTDGTREANEVFACFHQMREDELKAHAWRFAIRSAPLTAIDTSTMLITPPAWSAIVSYFPGQIVVDPSFGLWWSNKVYPNLNIQPGSPGDTTWELYFGPMTADVWLLPGSTPSAVAGAALPPNGGYFSSQLAYKSDGGGGVQVYSSLLTGNTDDPAVPQVWSATTTYNAGDIVQDPFDSAIYLSKINLNTNRQPHSNLSLWSTGTVPSISRLWRYQSSLTLKPMDLLYPLGVGPASQSSSRNIFRLPSGYLRRAPQDPKAGAFSVLGAPTTRQYEDWDFQDDYFSSATNEGVIIFRFVAQVLQVSRMDPNFCMAWAMRIARQVCEPLTQSLGKLQAVNNEYAIALDRASTSNAIEVGAVELPTDDWIACRV